MAAYRTHLFANRDLPRMSNDSPSAARARELLHIQQLLQDAQRQLFALPDVKPVSKEAMRKTSDDLDECNYALHKCEHAWKIQDQLQRELKQQQQQQQNQDQQQEQQVQQQEQEQQHQQHQ